MERHKLATIWWSSSLKFIYCWVSELERLLEVVAQSLLSGNEKTETQKELGLSESVAADRAELVSPLVSQDFM